MILRTGGWLRRLGCGVYLLSGDELNRDASLASPGTQVPGLHVAGKTVLGWRGVRHNLAFTERLVLWGDLQTALPAWFTALFLWPIRPPTCLMRRFAQAWGGHPRWDVVQTSWYPRPSADSWNS